MALAPWPNAGTQGRTAAVAKLRRVISALDETRAAELGEVAAAVVEEYAPGAPQAVKDEAVIRFAAYLSQRPHAFRGIRVAGVDVDFMTNHAAMFRHSGAAALLTRWKVRRGGIIG